MNRRSGAAGKLFEDLLSAWHKRSLPGWGRLFRYALSLGAAFVGGYAAYLADVPLAWLLGPLVVTAVLSVSGFTVWSSIPAQRFGQLVIGTGLGLNITAALLLEASFWIPVMIVTAFSAILVTSAFSVLLQRFGRLDRATAYFALMPGGLSEMANIGQTVGARTEPIALAQAIRVAAVVLILPPAIITLGIHGEFLQLDDALSLGYPVVAGMLVLAFIGVWAMRLLRMANPWMLGALATAATLSSTGLVEGQMPRLLFYGGQFLLGIVIGARFQRSIVAKLPRIFIFVTVALILIIPVLFAYATLLARVTELDLATAALASSAGGLVEMALTAEILQLNAALVLGFHVVRAFIVNGLGIMILNFLDRIRFFSTLEKSAQKVFGSQN